MYQVEMIERLLATLQELDRLYGNVLKEARRAGIDPYMMMDTTGQPLLSPIVVAQANTLAALVALRPNIPPIV